MMRSIGTRPAWRLPAFYSTVFLLGVLTLAVAPASAHTLQGMPLVLPWRTLPAVSDLNRDVDLTVMRLSEVPLATGAVAQTVVVDAVHRDRRVRRSNSLPLLLPALDVPLVQQLNQGLVLQAAQGFQAPDGKNGQYGQVVPVTLTETNVNGDGWGEPSLLLVVPTDSLPVLAELNDNMFLEVMRFSQYQAGQFESSIQTALVAFYLDGWRPDPREPFPLLVPAADLPALDALNVGTVIDIFEQFPVTFGNTGQVFQVADVDVWEDHRLLDDLNEFDDDDYDDDDDDDDDD